MATLASMLTPMVDDVDPFTRASLAQLLEEVGDVTTDVIGYEAASKSLPKIRKRAEHYTPSFLTKGGRAEATETSTLVISVGQLVEIFSRVMGTVQRDAHERRPADSILKDMVAIKGASHSIDIGRGAHEETIGGHMRF
jgi:hypothetical protein